MNSETSGGDLTLSGGEFDLLANWPDTRHFCGRKEIEYEFNWPIRWQDRISFSLQFLDSLKKEAKPG